MHNEVGILPRIVLIDRDSPNSENVMQSRGLTQGHVSLHKETWRLAGRIKMADKRLLMFTDRERAYKVSTMTKKKKFR